MKPLLRLIAVIVVCASTIAQSEELFPNKRPVIFAVGRLLNEGDTIGGYPVWHGNGKWRLMHLETTNLTVTERRFGTAMSRFPFGRAYFIQAERGKVVSSMEVRANLENSEADHWTDEPCKPDVFLWKKSLGSNVDVTCITLVHMVNFPAQAVLKPHLAQLRNDGIELPPTMLSITVTRFTSNSRRLVVQLNINPEAHGFLRESERNWAANPWHKDFAYKDVKKKEFIDHLTNWADAFAARVGGPAFSKDPKAFAGLANYHVGLQLEPLVAAGSSSQRIPRLPAEIAVPAWQVGDEWRYSSKSPTGDSTFVWAVNRIEHYDDAPHYVVSSGTRELFYRVSDVAIAFEAVNGVVVSRYTPHRTSYSWPLNVGKTWQQSYRYEEPVNRQTFDNNRIWEVESEEVVTVPAGTFRTVKIVLRNKNTGGLLMYRWYAPEVKQWVKEREYLSTGIRDREMISFKIQ